MQVWMLWYGGVNYGHPQIPEDIEEFNSLRDAKNSFDARADSWNTYYPCVERTTADEGGQSAYIYFYDPSKVMDPYPDRIIEYDPRGGLKVNRA